MYPFNREQAIVDLAVCAEARQTRPSTECCTAQCQKLGRVGEKQLRCQAVTRSQVQIEISVELFFVESRRGSASHSAILLGRGNHEGSIRKFGIEKRECGWIDKSSSRWQKRVEVLQQGGL